MDNEKQQNDLQTAGSSTDKSPAGEALQPMDMDAGTMHNGRLGGNFDNDENSDNEQHQNRKL